MEVQEAKVESAAGDSAYGSSANNSRNSQGSIKSLTSTWSCSSGYDQPPRINGHNKDEDAKKNLKNWQVKEFAAAINALTASACTNSSQIEISNDDRELKNAPSAIDDGGGLSKKNKLGAARGSSQVNRAIKTGSPTTQSLFKDPAFVVAISLHDGVVLHVSGSITELLGYPKDMWIGRNLIDFVYPKDRIVFTTHVTKELLENGIVGASNGIEAQKHSFHCRFRMYRGLRTSGFSLDSKRMAYRTFHLCTKLADLGSRTDNIVSSATCVLAVVTPVQSAYSVPVESPTMRPFTTRHSASCHFNHLDASAIPYLGYLPQDILGNSIFDYYHPEDLPHLQQVYEQVLKEESRLYRSNPYRFLARNGHYVLLETEWTCFINPWNRKLEFVIGQHIVIKGPKEPDVFAEAATLDACFIPDAVLEEGKNIQTEIKQILRETVKKAFEDSSKENRKRRKELAKYVGNLLEEMVQTLDLDTRGEKSFKEDESFSDHASSIVTGHISPHHQGTPSEPPSSPTLPSYHRCNYDDNIQRYFDSRPKTLSTDEQSATGSGENRHVAGVSTPPQSTDDDDVVNLSPPAADSGDDGASPMHEVPTEEARRGQERGLSESFQMRQPEVCCEIIVSASTLINPSQPTTLSSSLGLLGDPVGCLSTTMCPSYVRVALTERILSKHNEVTEKSFVQQTLVNINGVLQTLLGFLESRQLLKVFNDSDFNSSLPRAVRDIRSANFRHKDGDELAIFEARPPVLANSTSHVLQSQCDRVCQIIEPPSVAQTGGGGGGGSRLKRCGSHSPDLDTHKVNKHRHVPNSPDTSHKLRNLIGETKAVNLWPPFSITPAVSTSSTLPVDAINSKTPSVLIVPQHEKTDVVTTGIHPRLPGLHGCSCLSGGGTTSWSHLQEQQQRLPSVALNGSRVATHLLVPVQYVRAIDDGPVCPAHLIEPARTLQSYPHLVPGVALHHPVTAAAAVTSVLAQTPLSTPTIASLPDRVHIGLRIGTDERIKMTPADSRSTDVTSIKRPAVVTAKLDFTNMILSSSLFDLHRSKIQCAEAPSSLHKTSESAHLETSKGTSAANDSARPSNSMEIDGDWRLRTMARSTTEFSNASSSSSFSSSCHRPRGHQFDGLMQDDITGSSLNSFLRSDVDFSDCGSTSLKTVSSGEEFQAVASNKDVDDDILNRKKAVRRSSLRNLKADPILAMRKQPCWMEEVNLTREMINGYQMPCRDIRALLGSDEEKLRRMSQPDAVNVQLACLYDDVLSSHRRQSLEDSVANENLASTNIADSDSCVYEAMLSGQDLDGVSLYLLDDLDV